MIALLNNREILSSYCCDVRMDVATGGFPLERLTMAQRAAERIREQIRNGGLAPGEAVPEASMAATLGISRNTVREAFRLLSGEGLVAHNVHRGVVVRLLDEADVRDIYHVRRGLELGALRPPPSVTSEDLDGLRQAVAGAEAAVSAGDWPSVASSNLDFHQRLVALRRSPRMDQFFARLLAELRLGFAMVSDQEAFLLPYVDENRQLWSLLERGDWAGAATRLEAYLARSERTVLDAVRAGIEH
jgi:DNA-binding GntR family transcriptional regulator